MTSDPNRKTLRHFYCRDALWHSFERISEDFDRGIDELVNEAMRLYAREKGYLPTETDSPRATGARPAVVAPPPPPPPRRTAPPPASPPPAQGRVTSPVIRTPAGYNLPPPSRSRPVAAGYGPGSGTEGVQPENRARGGQAAHGARGAHGAVDEEGPPLYLLFQSQKYIIDKDQFIIGRGSKSSDLPIRDGNVSRKHAAVIRRNGAYFIKDLGSTNGIDFNGVRIDNKRIEEGDVFTICDYELRFTYR
jgi:hypothetical protein